MDETCDDREILTKHNKRKNYIVTSKNLPGIMDQIVAGGIDFWDITILVKTVFRHHHITPTTTTPKKTSFPRVKTYYL